MFLTRVLSGAVMTVLVAFTFVFGGLWLACAVFFISLIGYWELQKATGVHTPDKKINGLEVVGFLGITAYYAAICFADNFLISLLSVVATFMCTIGVYVITFPKYKAEQVMVSFFNFMYAPFMLSFIPLTRGLPDGAFLVWLIMISSWISDTFAYLVGMSIGKKKIFPVLSPKKSLEGCIGGVLGAGVVGAVYGYFAFAKRTGDMRDIAVIAVICAVGSVMSQIGDLAASAVKRNHGIKDYGKLIPGHGGIMDRFDSVIVTAPMIYFLAALFMGM